MTVMMMMMMMMIVIIKRVYKLDMTLKLNLRHWQSVSQVDDDEKVNWIIRRSVFVLRRHCHAIH